MIRPVTCTIDVPQSRERVFEHLDVLADHERFTDHFLVEWSVSGPRRGVGARARMRVKKPGRADWLEMEVVAAEPPSRSVEESVGARGRRLTRGTYTLEPTAAGGTRISFTLAWLRAPLGERLIAPLTRAVTRRANARSLRRLADELALAELDFDRNEPQPDKEGKR
ncbi:MAG TPA: SRPBCC family protein [Solirubrobacterales bacterium]|nr:SRPBCC family protein [Solirubrobacterales bacterium]